MTKVSKKFSFTFHRKIFLIFFQARSNISATYFCFGQFALKKELALLHHFRRWRHENCNCQNSCAWLCKICLATRFRYLVCRSYSAKLTFTEIGNWNTQPFKTYATCKFLRVSKKHKLIFFRISSTYLNIFNSHSEISSAFQ